MNGARIASRKILPGSKKTCTFSYSRVRSFVMQCGSFCLDMVGKRREGVKVSTKQRNQISLRFLLQPFLKGHAQGCHVESHQEADLLAFCRRIVPRVKRLTHSCPGFPQCL